MQGIFFSVNKSCLFLPLHQVDTVMHLVMLEPIPDAPSYVAGLMNMGGNNIPVIDLILRLGMERKKNYSVYTPLLLCSNETNKVGIIVDDVIGISDVNESSLQMQNKFDKLNSPFIASVTNNLGTALLLNLTTIINFRLSVEGGENAT